MPGVTTNTRYQALIDAYAANQAKLANCVKMADRVRAAFIASHGWPDTLCRFAEISALHGERLLPENNFAVSGTGETRCELEMQLALPNSMRSVPIRMPMFLREHDGQQWASLLSSNIGNDVTSELSDEELGKRLLALLDNFLNNEVAKRF